MNLIPYRRLNSTGEEEYEDIDSDIGIDESPSATSNSSSNISTPASPSLPANFNLEEHYTYLEARERLQQFPGQVPQKKKKVVSEKKPKSMVSLITNNYSSLEFFFELWKEILRARVQLNELRNEKKK